MPLWLLALISFSGTFGIHVLVPALPQAAAELGAGAGRMQFTISLYVIGLAVGQLVYGPVSDRFGRRPVLMAGLVIYGLAGAAAAIATSADALIAARLVQALGGCAGLVLARAILRDVATGGDVMKHLATMNLMVIVGPGVAPLVGSAITETLGWRFIFVVLGLMGALSLVLTWRLVPETRRGEGQGARGVLHGYARLLASPRFLAYAIGGGCATTALYAFVATGPFIFMGALHQSSHEVAIYLSGNIMAAWLGSLVASRLAGRAAPRRVLLFGSLVSCAGAAAFLLGTLLGQLSVPLVVGSMAVFAFGAGLCSPAALSLALSVNPRAAGSASGLYGFAQMGVGAVCAALAGLGSNPALAAGLVMAGAALLAQLAFLVAERSARS